VLNFAWRDYGNRVGAWRLIELLEETGFPATVLLNSAMYAYAPALVAAHRAPRRRDRRPRANQFRTPIRDGRVRGTRADRGLHGGDGRQ
jgi:hypothetical protein